MGKRGKKRQKPAGKQSPAMGAKQVSSSPRLAANRKAAAQAAAAPPPSPSSPAPALPAPSLPFASNLHRSTPAASPAPRPREVRTPAAIRPVAPPPPASQPAPTAPSLVAADAPPPAEPAASAPPPPLLFECAWEVCWQLGGIYTVLRSKATGMLERWGDRYFLIGPYNPNTAAVEFEEQPTEGFIRQALDKLREEGIPCHYGRWLIAGRPRVILLDYRARFRNLDADKYLLWKDHGISTDAGDGEMNEVVAFGFTVAEFFRHLSGIVTDRPLLAHFHEWMGGVAVPRLAHLKLPVATVFTTHATLLGRYLASNNPDFYRTLGSLNPDAEAAHFNIFSRYSIEKAAAHASTVFSTVSEVTAVEAEKLLGRTPDAILPNGLNIQRFAALHEFQNLHRHYKERIQRFVMGHFFPSYSFDLERTLYLFTSGRYEYRNKGMDLFIEAMWRLNGRLKTLPDPPTVVCFIITRAATRSVNVQALQSQSMFDELHNTCEEIKEEMGQRLFMAAARGRIPGYAELMHDDAQVRLKRALHAWRSSRQPLIVTHDLADDANDPVLKHLRHRALFNAADDPVKMVFHPEFLTATGPLLNLDYEQFVRGCHMGVFPSYYEPWGYTPMECIALGVPTVTTDLSGFGAYVRRHLPQHAEQGVYVLDRNHDGFDEAAWKLADHLFQFVQYNRRQRIELRNRVERLGEMFDWSELLVHYNAAHELALARAAGRVGKLEVRMV